jgi:hypothetical protein
LSANSSPSRTVLLVLERLQAEIPEHHQHDGQRGQRKGQCGPAPKGVGLGARILDQSIGGSAHQ